MLEQTAVQRLEVIANGLKRHLDRPFWWGLHVGPCCATEVDPANLRRHRSSAGLPASNSAPDVVSMVTVPSWRSSPHARDVCSTWAGSALFLICSETSFFFLGVLGDCEPQKLSRCRTSALLHVRSRLVQRMSATRRALCRMISSLWVEICGLPPIVPQHVHGFWVHRLEQRVVDVLRRMSITHFARARKICPDNCTCTARCMQVVCTNSTLTTATCLLFEVRTLR